MKVGDRAIVVASPVFRKGQIVTITDTRQVESSFFLFFSRIETHYKITASWGAYDWVYWDQIRPLEGK